MAKPLIIIGGLTVATLGVAPYFIGTNVESNINDQLAQLNEHPMYTAQVVTYNKGWFSSDAEIEVGIDFSKLAEAQDIPTEEADFLQNATIKAQMDLFHGPLYFGEGVGFGLAKFNVKVLAEEAREFIDWEKDAPLYTNTGVIGLFGGVSYADEIVSFSGVDDEGNGELTFSGYKGAGKTQGETLHYEGLAKSFVIKSDEFNFDLADLAVSADGASDLTAALAGELFDSSAVMSIDKMTITSPELGDEAVEIDVLKLDTSTDIDEDADNANITFAYSAKSIKAPDFEASDLVLALAGNNLDLDFIRAYQEFSNNSLTMTPDQVEPMLKEMIDTHLLPFLQAAPELNITKLAGTLPEGSFDGFMNTKLVDITELPVVMEDPAFWLTHILADAKMTADEGVIQMAATNYMTSQLRANPQTAEMSEDEIAQLAAQQVPMVLSMFTQQGFLTQEGDKYVTQMELKEGKAQVNGNEIPLPIGG